MEAAFLIIHQWITSGSYAAALGCFLWGAVSVLFSPCHLASIPLIVGYVAGQDRLVEGKQAVIYSVLFTAGLFITITAIGVICAGLGRMMGDVGSYGGIAIGVLLIWVALDMLGIVQCSMSGNLMRKFTLRGKIGALTLGLAYGALSGSCTFGFIAPILAIVTVQGKIITGLYLILLFAVGHCIPIAVAGSSAATVRRLMAISSWQRGGIAFRRLGGAITALLGLYFLA